MTARPRLKLGLQLGYALPGQNPADLVPLVREAESLGYDSAWVSEAWGSDAVTMMTWLAASTSTINIGSAIMQMPARTPANTAMVAATLDLMSGGRFLLGLGTSGPQVAEGWYGQPFAKPLARTREYVEIVRAVLRRELVDYQGEHYSLPYRGPGATGLGKPLKLLLEPYRADIPIYLGVIGPKSVAQAAEIADGWLPTSIIPEQFDTVFGPSLAAAPAGFEIVANVSVAVNDDVQAARDSLKPGLAFYFGVMGAKSKNFYNELLCRYGWEDAARKIQEHGLAGRQRDAAAAVPDDLVDALALVGPPERIRDRLAAWAETPITTLVVGSTEREEAMRLLAELVL